MAEQLRYLYEKPHITLEDVPYKTIIELTSMSVGYNVLSSEFLHERGVPEEVVNTLEGEYVQERSGLEIIQSGVMGYDLLSKICDDLNISKESFFESPANRAIDLRENIFGEVGLRMANLAQNPFLRGIDLYALDEDFNK